MRTVITIPAQPHIATLLEADIKEQKHSLVRLENSKDFLTITIDAQGFASLRATTNTLMQTIAVYTKSTGVGTGV